MPRSWKAAGRGVLSAEPTARALRVVTRSPVLPAEVRSLVHRRIGKHAHLRHLPSFEAKPPFGPMVRFHHGPTADHLWWLGVYEKETTSLFCRLARRAEVILDIGARDGVYALFALAANPSARVIAFEPDPDGASQLRANVAANPSLTAGRVDVVEVALGAMDGDAELFLAGGNSSLNPAFRPGSAVASVTVRKGDTVLAELVPGGRVDLVKVDTESTEPDVLEGLRQTIERDRPNIICEVLPGRTEERLEAFIGSVGYGAWQISDQPRRLPAVVADPTYGQPNLLFAPVEAEELEDVDANRSG